MMCSMPDASGGGSAVVLANALCTRPTSANAKTPAVAAAPRRNRRRPMDVAGTTERPGLSDIAMRTSTCGMVSRRFQDAGVQPQEWSGGTADNQLQPGGPSGCKQRAEFRCTHQKCNHEVTKTRRTHERMYL